MPNTTIGNADDALEYQSGYVDGYEGIILYPEHEYSERFNKGYADGKAKRTREKYAEYSSYRWLHC